MHYKVFLDTNIYDASAYSFRNGLFTQLRSYAAAGSLELQINSIVEGEVRKHIDKNIGDKVKDLNKAISARELRLFQTMEEFTSQLETKDKDYWINIAQDEFSSLLENCHSEKIDLTGSDVEEVFSDYFSRKYPFEEAKKDEFPDAFIIQSVLRQVMSLSRAALEHETGETLYYFNDIRTRAGAVEELRYCIVSNDCGFRNALEEKLGNHQGVSFFESLNDFVNYVETQNQKAKELQEEINKGFAKNEIIHTITTAIEDLEYEVIEYNGEVEEVNTLEQDNIEYKASVISLIEEGDTWSTVRLFIESSHTALLHYVYIDDKQSIWDEESKDYLWSVKMDKIAKYRAKSQFTAEIKVEFDEAGDPIDTCFESFIDMPYEVEVGSREWIEDVYIGKMPSDAED